MMAGRLLLVTPEYFPDGCGGAARQARILSEAMGRLGIDVTLVTPSLCPDAPAIERAEFGRIIRFHVRAYPNQGGRHMRDFLAWTRWFCHRFTAELRAGVPIYLFHARLHALGPALAAGEFGVPLMIKLGGGGEASDFKALRAKRFFYGRWVQSRLLRQTECFVANSARIVADLRELDVPDRRIAAFPNGVVLPPREQVAGALALRTGRRFINCARMVPDKRVAVLHEAALLLGRDKGGRPAHEMMFLGDGPERGRLAALAAGSAEGDGISFEGYRPDIYPALLKADFFVSASRREGQSNALLEAMSAGVIPVICDASGASDVVRHGENGFIVDESEPRAFTEMMRMVLDLPADRRRAMAWAARRSAEDDFGIDAIARRTIALFEDVAQRRRRAA